MCVNQAPPFGALARTQVTIAWLGLHRPCAIAADQVLVERDGGNAVTATYAYGQGIDEVLTMRRVVPPVRR